MTSFEAEVVDSQEAITKLKEEEAIIAHDRQRLIAVEADLLKRQQCRSITVSAAAQVGSASELVQQAEEVKMSERRRFVQSQELQASERHNLQQAEELRVTEHAAATVYAEWQNAEADLTTSQGLVESLEAQREVLRSELTSRLLHASDEQEQIQRLRQQVQTLEEELDIREDRLIRVEPLVVFKGEGRIDPRTASISSSPTRSNPRMPSTSSSPMRSLLNQASSPGRPASRSPQTESRQRSSQSPSKRVVDESSLQHIQSGAPMDATRTAPKNVQWLPPGRAQTILASSSLPIPGLASSMSSLPSVLQRGETSVSRPSSTQSMPSSLPAMLPKGASPVSSTSRIQLPRGMQS